MEWNEGMIDVMKEEGEMGSLRGVSEGVSG
jgi:hypothetical protein